MIILQCDWNKSIHPLKSNWEIIGPGGGGSTFTPTYSFHDTDHFMLHCDMTGNYLTQNGGKSYKQINFKGDVQHIAYDPRDSNVIYAAGTFLYKSSDAGHSWEVLFPGKGDIRSEQYFGDHAEYKVITSEHSAYEHEIGQIHSILADPARSKTIYFAMGSYFFYSFDDGQSWDKQKIRERIAGMYTNSYELKTDVYLFTTSAIYVFNKITNVISEQLLPVELVPADSWAAGTVKPENNTIFYALHHQSDQSKSLDGDAVWITSDLGQHWKEMPASDIVHSVPGLYAGFSKIVCSEHDAAKAYIICDRFEERGNIDSIVNWYGVLKTMDSGQTWHWVWKGGGGSGVYGIQDAIDAPNLNDAWAHHAFGKEFIQIIDIGVAPFNAEQVIITDWYRAMKSNDGGATWNEIYSKKSDTDSYTTRGLDVTTCYGVHVDPFDLQHISISYTDIGYHHSFNGGKSWQRSVKGIPHSWVNTCYWMVYDPLVKNKIWSVWSGLHDLPRGKMTRNPSWKSGALAQGGVCISTDGGITWQPTVEGMGMNSPSTSIILDPKSSPDHRSLYVAVYNKGVFKSTDGGQTWQLKNKGIGENTCAFELTLAENGDLFLVVSPTPMHQDGKKGIQYYSGAVYKSKDGAEQWTRLHVRENDVFPNGIALDPSRPGRIYLACWAGVNLSDIVGGDLVKVHGGDKKIDMPGGIFLSEDDGVTWSSVFDSTQYVYDVTVDPYHPGRVYCNTFNQAAYLSDDFGKNWKKIKGYDFHWGHRVIIDEADHEKIYLTTYGSSVWHGTPEIE